MPGRSQAALIASTREVLIQRRWDDSKLAARKGETEAATAGAGTGGACPRGDRDAATDSAGRPTSTRRSLACQPEPHRTGETSASLPDCFGDRRDVLTCGPGTPAFDSVTPNASMSNRAVGSRILRRRRSVLDLRHGVSRLPDDVDEDRIAER